jgi:phosphatidate cytidylyltransferase
MTRLLSGAALAVAAVAAILLLPLPGLRLLACLVALVAAREYLMLVQSGRRQSMLLPLVLVALVCWWLSERGAAAVLPLLLAGLAALAFEVVLRGATVERAAARFLAAWYTGMPLGLLVGVQQIGGPWATLMLVGTIAVSDSCQYYGGRAFGRRPLAPAISPKKTVEGALAGGVAAVLCLALAGPFALPGAGRASLAALGVAVAVLGICGDLFESRLKRTSGVKDSGSLIPGHGGVLDRIDALLFAAPVYYLYLRA